jgi:hypothetical protein
MGDGITALFGAPPRTRITRGAGVLRGARMRESVKRYTDEVRHSRESPSESGWA